MNLELLSKLYEQSHKTVPHKPISGFDARWEDRVFVPEVFAELIVQECMRMCDVADMSLLEHNCVKEASGTQSAKDFIKEHFGVEE